MSEAQSISSVVILAAGQGTRFGGAKQFATFGPLAKTLMEYNLCHAIDAGFTQVVFIIRAVQKEQLTQQIIQHLPKHIKVEIAFQCISDLPKSCHIAKERSKPLGTAHALWCARSVVSDNFIIINADDYYGPEAFQLAAQQKANSPFMVAYQLTQTLSKHGGVNRGLCKISNKNNLLEITEYHDIKQTSSNEIYGQVNNNPVKMHRDCLISMNFWGLHHHAFQILEQILINTFHSNSLNDECYLPDIITTLIAHNKTTLSVLTSHDEWFGVTYAADSAHVNNKITELTNKGLFSSLSKNKK